MTTPTLPTVDQIVDDPGCLAGLPPASLAVLLAQVAAVQNAITARLVLAAAAENCNGAAVVADEMLSVKQVAELLRRSPRWIWRSQKKLPFLRRVGGRGLLASRRDLDAWLARQRIVK